MNDLLQKLFPRRTMQFSPVEEDDDLSSLDISGDPERHENNWDLHESVDPADLDTFWTNVVQELGAMDPEDTDATTQ